MSSCSNVNIYEQKNIFSKWSQKKQCAQKWFYQNDLKETYYFPRNVDIFGDIGKKRFFKEI